MMMSIDSPNLDDFDGTVRLFPLPNVVLFPQVVQPLHIFEPRYRQMVEDALEDNRLIALCLLNPFGKIEFKGKPVIYPYICIGKIFQEEILPDGRFNLLLHGVTRAKIITEIENDKLYRTAKVLLIEDIVSISEMNASKLRSKLCKNMAKWFTYQPSAKDQLDRLVNSDLSLGNLCDVFSFALPLTVELKIHLLELLNVEERANFLIQVIEHMTPEVPKPPEEPGFKKYPPDFSAN